MPAIHRCMKLDMELEAEFDAQAFGRDLRAIMVRIFPGRIEEGANFVLSATVPWDTDAADGMERVKRTLLEDEACYVLFRTLTWALITFVPDGAPRAERMLYTDASATLRELLGGSQRVPNARRWASLSDVQLDDEIAQAPAFSLGSPAEVAAAVRAGERTAQLAPQPTAAAAVPAALEGPLAAAPSAAASAAAAAAAVTPAPPEAALLEGQAVVLQGLVARADLNGRRGRALTWQPARQRLGVEVEGVGPLSLKVGNLRLLEQETGLEMFDTWE